VTPEHTARLTEVAAIAVRIEAETECPARMLLAQWALESKWGEKKVGKANYFGIKRAMRHTKWCTVTTHEVWTQVQVFEWNARHQNNPARIVEQDGTGRSAKYTVVIDDDFADYDSLEESCRDYAWLITHGKPYHAAWREYMDFKDVDKLIKGIAHVYATAPAYAELVHQLAFQAEVTQVISLASSITVNA